MRRAMLGCAVIGLLLGAGAGVAAQGAPAPSAAGGKEVAVSHAQGSFEVKLTPQTKDEPGEGAVLGRLGIDKKYHGDLEATGKGEMLTATAVNGSAAYVAIERVSGTLRGKKGTFALQHAGTMARGEKSLVILVVPDSGTGELAGIVGRLSIGVEDGKHSYDLEYTLPATP